MTIFQNKFKIKPSNTKKQIDFHSPYFLKTQINCTKYNQIFNLNIAIILLLLQINMLRTFNSMEQRDFA
jgi:hypothetical protein